MALKDFFSSFSFEIIRHRNTTTEALHVLWPVSPMTAPYTIGQHTGCQEVHYLSPISVRLSQAKSHRPHTVWPHVRGTPSTGTPGETENGQQVPRAGVKRVGMRSECWRVWSFREDKQVLKLDFDDVFHSAVNNIEKQRTVHFKWLKWMICELCIKHGC